MAVFEIMYMYWYLPIFQIKEVSVFVKGLAGPVLNVRISERILKGIGQNSIHCVYHMYMSLRHGCLHMMSQSCKCDD